MADSLPCINLTVNLNVSLVATPENMESLKKKESKSTSIEISAFYQNKPATSQQYYSLRTNQPSATSQPNRLQISTSMQGKPLSIASAAARSIKSPFLPPLCISKTAPSSAQWLSTQDRRASPPPSRQNHPLWLQPHHHHGL
jgi:hypothetical protein